MTLDRIRAQVMFQTNNDVDDLPDFQPHLNDYINEGYDLLVEGYRNQHVQSGSAEFPPLENPGDEPKLPEYAHRAIADYATYMVYRNGNAVKQNRGNVFYSMFMGVLAQLKYERGRQMDGKPRQFVNIYTT